VFFFLTVNYTLVLVNGSVIGAIFIFFAIASEASVSSVFSIAEKRCSFGFSLDLQESQIAVVIAVGILLVPFSLSSVLALIHNKWANLLTAIGFAFITISASVIVSSLACRLPENFFLLVILHISSILHISYPCRNCWHVGHNSHISKKEGRIQRVINIGSKYENTIINDFSLSMKTNPNIYSLASHTFLKNHRRIQVKFLYLRKICGKL
jgi:hypothetical protein